VVTLLLFIDVSLKFLSMLEFYHV